MKISGIPDAFAGEKLAAVFPPLAPYIADPARPARLNYFPGRNLTAEALQREQAIRVQMMQLRGQAVSPGVVDGLEVALLGNSALQISAGRALAADGTDIVVDHTVTVQFGDLKLYEPPEDAPDPTFDPNVPAISEFLSQIEAPAAAEFITVLVLQPGYILDAIEPQSEAEDDGEFHPYIVDRENQPFEKQETTDSVRALLCHWRKAPAISATWRSATAWAIFDAERAGTTLPWVALGVPLAVVALDVNRRPLWLDRYSVVREGGHPRQRILFSDTGEARLWQSQFDQFSNQLGDVASLDPAATNFVALPPVGILPKVFVDLVTSPGPPLAWTATQRFFPPGYMIDITVAPLEELDTVIADRRSLAPYRLDQPDAVNLLLPVPTQWYDPRLLEIEVPAPDFQTTIDSLSVRRADKLAARLDLRGRASAINVALTGQPLSFPNPDPAQLEPNEAISAPPQPDAQYGTTRNGEDFANVVYTVDAYQQFQTDAAAALKTFTPADEAEFATLQADPTLAAADLAELNAYIAAQQTVQADETAKLQKLGLADFINYLTAKADAADELIDSGFLKVRTDVYRLSQLLTNNSFATQFVASPTLANIIQRRSVLTDPAAVNQYASQLLANFAPSPLQTTSTTTTTPAAPSNNISENVARRGAVTRPVVSPVFSPVTPVITPVNPVFNPVTPVAPVNPVFNPVTPVENPVNPVFNPIISPVARASTIGTFVKYDPTGGVLGTVVSAGTIATTDKANLDAVQSVIASSNLSDAQKKAFTDLRNQADTLGSPAGQAGLAEIGAIGNFASSYVPNYDNLSQKQIRTIPLDRLQPALAPQARQEIHQGRLDIFERLARLNISLADLTSDFVDSLPAPAPATPTAPVPTPVPTRFTFQRLIMQRQFETISTVDASTNTVIDADESKNFSSAVEYSDMSVAALRAVEARVTDYRNLIAEAQAVLASIQNSNTALTGAANQVADDLDEARHDVAVAEALLQEEQLRLAAINSQRAQILNQHVKFVVYGRPRAVSFRQDAPIRVVEPALAGSPIPDCLQEDLVLPPDLATLRETFRGSPSNWFKLTPTWLGTIDRLDQMQGMLGRVVSRFGATAATLDPAPVATSGRYTAALSHVFDSRIQISQTYTSAASDLAAVDFTRYSWSDLQQMARQKLTLGHLIDAGSATVSSSAATELTNIFKVAACLHRDFCSVPPLVRLVWAEAYSQFDGPADFRDLSTLPKWATLDFTLRREMQLDTDWLFGQIDATQQGALDMMNDLIRVCLLLSAHAPVDQLILGTVVEPVTPSLGGLLRLQIDPARVHIGMEAVYDFGAAGLVKARVEDISSGLAVARVTTTASGVTLLASTSMRLQEAGGLMS